MGLTTRKGARVAKQSFHQMMVNPTYKGWIVSRTRNVLVRGTHEPIVDESTFEAVQRVISGNGAHQVPHVLCQVRALRKTPNRWVVKGT